jgi:hypothetical protein
MMILDNYYNYNLKERKAHMIIVKARQILVMLPSASIAI